jgi:hydroxyacylglutathione hydrolase
VVDPQHAIEPYLEAAAQKSMRITHIFETHVQADHLSGARPLSSVTRAPVLYHKAAPVKFPHVELDDAEEHEMGNVRVTVVHTPGHTPDSVSLIVTDRSRAQEPWFVLTGDTLLNSCTTASTASCWRYRTMSRSSPRTLVGARAAVD